MSWDFHDSTIVKRTRKIHRCAFCNRTIPAGSKNIFHWWGMYEGEFQNSYSCNWCHKHEGRLIYDGEIADFWECLREDIFRDEFKKYKECDCIDERGFSGNIEVEFNGDYLIFKCEDCGKEWHREYMAIEESEGEE